MEIASPIKLIKHPIQPAIKQPIQPAIKIKQYLIA
jgi:hypothetical protein